MSKAAQQEARQRWAVAKPKLDNVRSFFDPDDMEFWDALQKTREKVGRASGIHHALLGSTPWARGKPLQKKIRQSKIKIRACLVEAHESTRTRHDNVKGRDHKDLLQKVFKSLTHHSSVHNATPTSRAMKNPDAKVAVDTEREKIDESHD